MLSFGWIKLSKKTNLTKKKRKKRCRKLNLSVPACPYSIILFFSFERTGNALLNYIRINKEKKRKLLENTTLTNSSLISLCSIITLLICLEWNFACQSSDNQQQNAYSLLLFIYDVLLQQNTIFIWIVQGK